MGEDQSEVILSSLITTLLQATVKVSDDWPCGQGRDPVRAPHLCARRQGIEVTPPQNSETVPMCGDRNHFRVVAGRVLCVNQYSGRFSLLG